MGWKLCRVDLEGEDKVRPNEEKEITIVLAPENRAVIHGVVKFPNGMPAKCAVVKLFKKKGCDPCDLEPVTFAFTDCCGQFMFGVNSNVEYVIKVFFFVPERRTPSKEFNCKDCECDCDDKHHGGKHDC